MNAYTEAMMIRIIMTMSVIVPLLLFFDTPELFISGFIYFYYFLVAGLVVVVLSVFTVDADS